MFTFLMLAGVLFTAVPQTVRAEMPPLIPRDVLFGNPEKSNPQISPDGTHLAYLAPDAKNVLQVWVQTIGKDDAVAITKDSHRGIRDYLWAPGGAQVLYFQDNDGDENFHMYASDMATKETRDLTPFSGVRALPVAWDPKFPNEMLVGMNRRSKQVFDV
jgi:Tol biopolymer transport system component